MSEAIAVVRARRVEAMTRTSAAPMASFDRVFRERWTFLASGEFRRYFLLNQELIALALREPRRYQSFLGATTEEWRTGLAGVLLGAGYTAEDASATSTLYMAGLRGLLLDLAVTRDAKRVQAAVDLLAERLKADLERYTAAT